MKKLLLMAMVVSFGFGPLAYSTENRPRFPLFQHSHFNGTYAYSFGGSATVREADREDALNVLEAARGKPLEAGREIPLTMPVQEVGIMRAYGAGFFEGEGRAVVYGKEMTNRYECSYRRDPKIGHMASADCIVTSTIELAAGPVVETFRGQISLVFNTNRNEVQFVLPALKHDLSEIDIIVNVSGTAKKI